jgi:hypothetical protein
LSEASFTELKEVTGFTNDRMMTCIQELQSLFLLSAPKIVKDEQRFNVSNNLATLILENENELVSNPTEVRHKVNRLRSESNIGRIQHKNPVGRSITQAVALLKNEEWNRAIATVDATLKDFKNDKDLLLMKARCFFERYEVENTPSDLGTARTLFYETYKHGQRKLLLYNLWYISEMAAKSFASARDVATHALADGVGHQFDWFKKRADASYAEYKVNAALNPLIALDLILECSGDISDAMNVADVVTRHQLQEFLYEISGEVFDVFSSQDPSFSLFRKTNRVLIQSIECGDTRATTFSHLISTLEVFQSIMQPKDQGGFERRLRQCRSLLRKYLPQGMPKSLSAKFYDRLDDLEKKASAHKS